MKCEGEVSRGLQRILEDRQETFGPVIGLGRGLTKMAIIFIDIPNSMSSVPLFQDYYPGLMTESC